jgi:hypothetical protein
MRKQSEALLLVPLLPIFLAGLFPMLVLALLGFAGLGLLGILLICRMRWKRTMISIGT